MFHSGQRMRERWERCSSLLLTSYLIATTRQQLADVNSFVLLGKASLRVSSNLSTSCQLVVTCCNHEVGDVQLTASYKLAASRVCC